MRLLRTLAGVVAFSIAWSASSASIANEPSEINLMERMLDQRERQLVATAAHAAVLERITDRASADAAVADFQGSSEALLVELEKMLRLFEAGQKYADAELLMRPEDEPRMEAIERRRPLLEQEAARQISRYEAQLKRIDGLTGLSSRFWDVFKVADLREQILRNELRKRSEDGLPPLVEAHLRDRLALFEKYGAAKVVEIEIEGGGERDVAALERSLRQALGPNLKILSATSVSRNLRYMSIAPVDNFGDVVAAVEGVAVVGQDAEKGSLRIRVEGAPQRVAGRRRPFAQEDAGRYKEGDRVEVQAGFDWKPGTVVGVNHAGWLEVRLDESELPDHFPEHVRERMQTRPYPAEWVRPLTDAGANEDMPPRRRRATAERPAPMRTWTDRTGKFSTEARYAEVEGDSVVLIKSDGKRITVPLEKLSDRDRQYVARQNEQSR